MEETKITVNGKEVESIGMQETPMFADREDIMEAFNYAKEVMERSTSSEMAIYGTTAIQVVWNTIANKYHLIPKD
tara:strand:+ start:297 stop:521 length:225 start_codon:yes stop_codon:yes gene_type:complete